MSYCKPFSISIRMQILIFILFSNIVVLSIYVWINISFNINVFLDEKYNLAS